MEKRVGLYARTSMSDQNSNSQLLALRQYCEKMGYRIVDKYIDNGFSGKTTQRPEFERLMGDIRANRLDCVVVYIRLTVLAVACSICLIYLRSLRIGRSTLSQLLSL